MPVSGSPAEFPAPLWLQLPDADLRKDGDRPWFDRCARQSGLPDRPELCIQHLSETGCGRAVPSVHGAASRGWLPDKGSLLAEVGPHLSRYLQSSGSLLRSVLPDDFFHQR